MSNKPKVSVILPVYNASLFLEQCIGSITSQTLTDLEIICIDDCSTDNSVEIIKSLQEKDSRIKIIQQETNLGAGAARNVGMAAANGEYLSFLDADDYFSANMFATSVEQADALDLDVFVVGANAFNASSGEETRLLGTIKTELLPDSSVFCANDVKQDFFQVFIWWAWDKLFRRSFIERHQLTFMEIRTSNDLLFTASAVLLAERVAYTSEPLAVQRQKVDSSLSNTRHLSYDCCLQATVALKEFLQQRGVYDRYERDFKNYALNFLIWNVNSIGQGAYASLYHAVKEFYSTLSICREEIYYQPFYDAYLFILEHSAEEYLFYLRMNLGHDIEASHNRIAVLEEQLAESKNVMDALNEKVEHLSAEADSVQVVLNEALAAKELTIQEHKNSNLKYEETYSKLAEDLEGHHLEFAQQSRVMATVLEDLSAKSRELEQVYASLSWKITEPLRWLIRKFR